MTDPIISKEVNLDLEVSGYNPEKSEATNEMCFSPPPGQTRAYDEPNLNPSQHIVIHKFEQDLLLDTFTQ